MKVFLTTDVEIWCDGWKDLDNQFKASFQSYIYGRTSKGSFGLPYQLKILQDHDLKGVFFVEPLFSLRFGEAPLSEIVGQIAEFGQAIDLHLHTEWVDESPQFLPEPATEKRQYIRNFSFEDQVLLINKGKELLLNAGAAEINAFRAGSFGFNTDTLSALKENQIFVDSSYNATKLGLSSGLAIGQTLTQSFMYDGVNEVPMTVFIDRPGNLRHTQLCACSFRELEGLLWQALEEGREEFVILSHNFELLNNSKTKPNSTVVNRYIKLCNFLDKNRDYFTTSNFKNISSTSETQPPPLKSQLWKTGLRYAEQALSKF